MRILMLCPSVPWPLHNGSYIRIYHLLKELAGRGHEVELVAGYEDPRLPPGHPVGCLCRDVHLYRPPAAGRLSGGWYSAVLSLFSPLPYTAAKLGTKRSGEALRRVLARGRFDLIWVNYAFMAYALDPRLVGNTPVVVDQNESEELLWGQYRAEGSWAQRTFAALNLLKLRHFRKKTLFRAHIVFFVSEREAAFARGLLPPRVRVMCLPNGADVESFVPQVGEQEGGDRVLICGNFSVYRNRAAVLWFATRVFPRIRQSIAGAEFWIIGRDPSEEIRQLGRTPGICVTGAVEDTRPYYANAKVVVAPYRFGEGTRLKVLEAMAMGMPVVSTALGVRGIEVTSGRHVLVANDEADFANQVVDLLRDPEMRQAIGNAARKLVEEKYSWKGIIGKVEPTLHALAGPSGATSQPARLWSGQAAVQQDS